MVHPRNPLPDRPSYPHRKQQAAPRCQYERPQEYKAALMPHLLKQQDYFLSLDRVLNSQIKLPEGHRAWGEKKNRGVASKIFSSQNYLLFNYNQALGVKVAWRMNDEVGNELLFARLPVSFTNYNGYPSYSEVL